MKRKRYREGWIVEFPDGSPWREARETLKDIARLRREPLGACLLEAIEQWIQREGPKYLPGMMSPKKGKT